MVKKDFKSIVRAALKDAVLKSNVPDWVDDLPRKQKEVLYKSVSYGWQITFMNRSNGDVLLVREGAGTNLIINSQGWHRRSAIERVAK